MIESSPAYLWYPGDVLSSGNVAELTAEEECWYRRGLDYAWKDQGVPSDPERFAARIGKGCTINAAAKILATFFSTHKKDPSKSINRRQEKERTNLKEKRAKRKEAGRLSGVSRRKKKELTPEQSSNKTRTKTNISTSISTSISNTQKEGAFAFPTDLLDSLKNYLGVVQLPNESEWLGLADFAEVNLYTIDQVLECYKFLEGQSWRSGPISPKAMQNNLPKFVKETSNPKPKFDIDFSSLQTQ